MDEELNVLGLDVVDVSHHLDKSVDKVAASIGKRLACDIPVSAEEFVDISLVEYHWDLDLLVEPSIRIYHSCGLQLGS